MAVVVGVGFGCAGSLVFLVVYVCASIFEYCFCYVVGRIVVLAVVGKFVDVVVVNAIPPFSIVSVSITTMITCMSTILTIMMMMPMMTMIVDSKTDDNDKDNGSDK